MQLDYDSYKNHEPYPAKPPRPSVPRDGTPEAFRNYADELERYERVARAYREACIIWQRHQTELDAQFKKDALREAGLEGHPKADLVWSKAWEHGHASGYSEVAYWLEELAELVL